MATKTTQRIGIWIIAGALVFGTIGSFAVMILAPKNHQADQGRAQEQYAQYQESLDAYQEQVTAQATELSEKYYDEFSQYESVPAAFDKADVTKLETKDLKIGSGEVITKDSEYSAYYIGWNPQGEVFDSSFDGERLKAPIAGGNLIEGWNEGVVGMKTGGVRLLTIPAEQAYGEQGQGDNIPPNTPLKFIVMIIPKVEEIPVPDLSGLGQ